MVLPLAQVGKHQAEVDSSKDHNRDRYRIEQAHVEYFVPPLPNQEQVCVDEEEKQDKHVDGNQSGRPFCHELCLGLSRCAVYELCAVVPKLCLQFSEV